MKKTALFVILLLGYHFGMAQNFDTVKIQPLRVAENIYMLTGSGGNLGVLTGKEGILLIDDQYAPLSEKIKAAIQTLDATPIRFLVNTHIHGDHTGGNENFKRAGVTIFALDVVRDRMTREQVNKVFNRTTPPREKDALPVVTFSNKITFHLNDEDIEAFHFGPGHTDGDVMLHFKKANVFHTGDLFVRYGYPFIDADNGGSVTSFVANLDQLIPLLNDDSKIIPGHGALATKADVINFRNMLADIRNQVSEALRKGKKPEEIPALGITDKYESVWGKGFLKGKDFVLLIAGNIKAGK